MHYPKTVSSWLKMSFKNTRIDFNMDQVYRLHNTSASNASLHGLISTQYLKASGWSRESSFEKYYKQDLHIDQSLQSSLL